MEMNELNKILTIEEVMDMLNAGKNTVYKLLDSGEIKAFKLGNKWKVPYESVYDYIRKNAGIN